MQDQPVTLWILRRERREVSCLARLTPYGIDVDIAQDGSVVVSRVFESDQEALAWADRKRAVKEADGWSPVPVEQTTPNAFLA